MTLTIQNTYTGMYIPAGAHDNLELEWKIEEKRGSKTQPFHTKTVCINDTFQQLETSWPTGVHVHVHVHVYVHIHVHVQTTILGFQFRV